MNLIFGGILCGYWLRSQIASRLFYLPPWAPYAYQDLTGVKALSLTEKQKNFIAVLDSTAKQILQHGGDAELLMSLAHKMHQIKDIMDAASKSELNFYCQRYEGFYQYMKLLERMAKASSEGAFDDLIKKNDHDGS